MKGNTKKDKNMARASLFGPTTLFMRDHFLKDFFQAMVY